MTASQLYYYKAYVTRVPSGDTCRVDLDLGLGIWIKGMEIRLHRIQVPRNDGTTREAAAAARDHLRSLIMDREVLLRTIKDRKGRVRGYLGEMTVVTDSGESINVNAAMVAAGHAIPLDAQTIMAD